MLRRILFAGIVAALFGWWASALGVRPAPLSVASPVPDKVTVVPPLARERVRELVRQNFPAALLTDELKGVLLRTGALPSGRMDFRVGDLAHDGLREWVAAVYSDGVEARLQILRREGDELFSLPDASAALMGKNPSVRLVDLLDDGGPEIVVYLAENGGMATWIFRFNGRTLESIGPTARGVIPRSLLVNAVFLDLDGDGVLELVNKAEMQNNIPVYPTFRYDRATGRYHPYRMLRNLYQIGGLGYPCAAEADIRCGGLPEADLLDF
jgi:hypothetical protein